MKHDLLPLAQLQSWATLNDVKLHGVRISPNIVTEDGISKGGGVVSTTEHSSGDVLLLIPNDLILSKERVLQCAKTDKHFREAMDALGDFIEVGTHKVSSVHLLRYCSDSKKSYSSVLAYANDHLEPRCRGPFSWSQELVYGLFQVSPKENPLAHLLLARRAGNVDRHVIV